MKLAARLSANPLLFKELATRMRSRATPAAITLFLAVTSGIGFMIYLIGTSSGTRRVGGTGEYGPALFYFLVAMQLIAASFVTPAFAAGAISTERQRGTLLLLRAAGLSARSIVLSKFIVAVGYALLFVFVSLPLFSLALLLGGIEPFELLIALMVIVASSVLFVALALFFSATARSQGLASALTYAFTVGIVIGIPILMLFAIAGAQNALGFSMRGGGYQVLRDLIEGVFGLTTSLSPFSAIIASRAHYEATGDVWLFKQAIFGVGTGVTLPAPYITLALVYFAGTVLLMIYAVRRIDR